MKPDLKMVMKIKSCKDTSKLFQICQSIYLQGFTDAQDGIVDDSKRFIHVKKGTSYEFTCPDCGTTMVLDMEDLLKQQEEGDSNE